MTSYFEECISLEKAIELRGSDDKREEYIKRLETMNEQLKVLSDKLADFVRFQSLLPGIKSGNFKKKILDFENEHDVFYEMLDDPAKLESEERTSYMESLNDVISTIEEHAKSVWNSLFNHAEFSQFISNELKLPQIGDFNYGLRELKRLKNFCPISQLDEIINGLPKNCKDLKKGIEAIIGDLSIQMKIELDETEYYPTKVKQMIKKANSATGYPLQDLDSSLLDELIDFKIVKNYKVVPIEE